MKITRTFNGFEIDIVAKDENGNKRLATTILLGKTLKLANKFAEKAGISSRATEGSTKVHLRISMPMWVFFKYGTIEWVKEGHTDDADTDTDTDTETDTENA